MISKKQLLMKKRLFSYWIAMCILSTNLMAQVPLVKEGATWYYGFHLKGEDNYGYVKMTYLGDSFVQNALHHRIKEEEYTYDPIMDDVVKTDDDLLFVRNEIDSLFLTDLTIFNRNAMVGDTMGITGDSLNPVIFVYSEIGMLDIEGSSLQHQTVTAICGGDTTYTFEVVDQIGIIKGPHKHFNWIHAHACEGEGWTDDPLKIYNFRCYMDEEISFMSNVDVPCDASGQIISSIDNTADVNLIMYPNPADEVLFIEGIQNHHQILIYDQLGRQVLKDVITNQSAINIKSLESGLYIVSLPELEITRLIKVK